MYQIKLFSHNQFTKETKFYPITHQDPVTGSLTPNDKPMEFKSIKEIEKYIKMHELGNLYIYEVRTDGKKGMIFRR